MRFCNKVARKEEEDFRDYEETVIIKTKDSRARAQDGKGHAGGDFLHPENCFRVCAVARMMNDFAPKARHNLQTTTRCRRNFAAEIRYARD